MKKFLPYFLLTLSVLLIAVTNFVPGAYLIGWDNLQIELSPWLNLKRAIFTGWQEYQGTGLAGGMGHAADLFRQLFLFLLYPVIPQHLIRFVWTMFTLLLGAFGMYILMRQLFSHAQQHETHWLPKQVRELLAFSYTPRTVTVAAFLSALFYVYNIGTLQSYYIPFEVFTAQFASLPWLLLGTFNYLLTPNVKTRFYLVLILLLSTPTGYVPTVFVVYCMAAGILALFLRNPFFKPPILENGIFSQDDKRIAGPRKNFFSSTIFNLKHILSLFLIIFAVNAFWILPFSYFTITSSHINVNAKINQMSTENIFSLNKEYGTLQDVILLKGFWYQSTEPTLAGTYQYLVAPWRDHIQNPFISSIGYLFFAIIVLGVSSVFLRKNKLLFSFAALFVFTITMLLTATPPFSWIDDILRNYVPLFGQVFRFPFTKFSLLGSAMYAVFFGIGIACIIELFRHQAEKNYIRLGIAATTVGLLVLFMWPAFTGHFFYSREQLKIPQDYHDLFAYFKTQDPHTRIANFPQPSFWSWSYYTWEYSGSGFLWYGIQQPILDRAFDVWSNYSENYYFEVAQAIYTKNPQLLSDVLEKYQVTWILLDKNIVNPTSPKALFVPEFEELLSHLPSVNKEKTFGKLDVYKVTLASKPNAFVFLQKNLPTVNAYGWSNNDVAYQTLGNYIAKDFSPRLQPEDQKPTTNDQPTYIYPFHSLFSLKTEKEKAFTLSEQSKTITVTKQINLLKDTIVHIPSLKDTESFLPMTIQTERGEEETTIFAVFQTPKLAIDDSHLWETSHSQVLFTVPNKTLEVNRVTLNSNGTTNMPIPETTKTLGTTLVSLREDNILTLTDSDGEQQTISIPAAALQALPLMQPHSFLVPKGTHTLTVTMPKVSDTSTSYKTNAVRALHRVQKCDVLRPGTVSSSLYYEDEQDGVLVESTNATACLSLYTPNLSHRYGYAIFVKSKNISGRSLHVWVENIDQHYVPLDTYVTRSKTPIVNSYVLSPQDPYGNYYALQLENISVGSETTKNVLFQIGMYPMPYNFLTSLYLSNEDTPITSSNGTTPTTVLHPNESIYDVTLPPTGNETLVLSQAYNPGWQAYSVPPSGIPLFHQVLPFLVGKRLDDHVMVNNWENGWKISSSSQPQRIIIVYLPQYLEYVGLIMVLAIVTISYKNMLIKPHHDTRE